MDPSQEPASSESREGRAAKVQEAVKTWTAQLVDLGGRNSLLYYKDLKQGTLDLSEASGADQRQVGALLSGRVVRLSSLFTEPDLFTVVGQTALSKAARRCRAIRAKAKENYEERGLDTLFIGWGLATWENTRGLATPAAPVLLRQLRLNPRGAASEDFDLVLLGEYEVNPALLHLLSVDFSVDLTDDLIELLDQQTDPPEPQALFDFMKAEAGDVPGFGISERLVVGNFSYAKLPMVRDLEGAVEQLVEHDLIAAIAGDEEARDLVRARQAEVALDLPDHIPPADEFLILDADASQNYAINAILAGSDLVIEGPPGTGKSQTIANLIATLVARGKKVLFVAEKRAAIDAALGRLKSCGLESLVLDLHDGGSNRRRLAEEIAHGLRSVASIPQPRLEPVHRSLTARRQELRARTDALHRLRSPWGLSLYSVQAELLGIPAAVRSEVRLGRSTLSLIDAAAFDHSSELLRSYSDGGGFGLSRNANPWAAALEVGTITNAHQSERALALVRTIHEHTLPGVLSEISRIEQDTGIDMSRLVALWKDRFELLDRVASTLRCFSSTIYTLPLEQLVTDLVAAEKSFVSRAGAAVLSSKYRKAVSMLRGMSSESRIGSKQLLGECRNASEQLESWHTFSPMGSQPRVPARLEEAEGTYRQLLAELQELSNLLGRDDLGLLSVEEIERLCQSLIAERNAVYSLPELHRLRTELHDLGLAPVMEEVAKRNLDTISALACLKHVWLSSILETLSLDDSQVATFRGEVHSRTVTEFQASDNKHIRATPIRVLRSVAEQVTRVRDAHPDQSQLIEDQARRRRGHLPMRQLFHMAPDVLTALKPCWAMSPLVVSQLLPPQRQFDVVVFDEASQVRPSDAVSAILRGRQTVVAGDAKQLPPTMFFLTSTVDDEDCEAEWDETVLSLTHNMESVLDVVATLLPQPKGTRSLQWHYRSRDERLIAFSNAHLYHWSLTTFPGTTKEECLSFVHVPFRLGSAGQETSATDEVEKVVDLVLAHARTRPTESLGVIAMGIKHADRIIELLRQRRAEMGDCNGFFDEGREEPFFVKNLERVQGDERDAIILTIGYGKTADGRVLYRFGPLNTEGGERRLNVAVTRAKRRLTLVSSLNASDLDPDRLRAQGARLLRLYLQYAESQGSSLGDAALQKPELNPFERDVWERLDAVGIPLVPQYGVSGYYVDFAAKHRTHPGRMVLAIECDGAGYHSTPTARDRDRLRQEHLERLGWRFHRIWSTEWFRAREREIERALAAYENALVLADDPGEESQQASGTAGAPRQAEVRCHEPVSSVERGKKPPVPLGLPIQEYSQENLVDLVRWIESDTLLRTEEQLLNDLVDELGFQRRGARIEARLREAIDVARGKRLSQTALAANRRALRGPRPAVRPGHSIQEYSQAQLVSLVRWIESDKVRRTKEELLTEIMTELGFGRRGSRIVQVLSNVIDVAHGQARSMPIVTSRPRPRPRQRKRRW